MAIGLWPQAALNDKPGVWAGDRIIDIHGHIGSYRGYDLNTATLLDNIQRYGIRLTLVSNIDGAELPGTTLNLDELSANLATIETVRRYPEKLRGLLWTRPKDGSPAKLESLLAEKLTAKSSDPLFVGLKIHPDMNHFPADDARVDAYLKLCEKYRIPAVFHSGKAGGDSDPARIYAIARRHPTIPIVLYHMGFGRDHANAIAIAKEAFTKKDARLYLETAQAEPDAVFRAIEELDSEHVLFGTDATYYGRDHYARYVELLARLKRELQPNDFQNVVYRNAERLFRLR